MSKFDRKSSKGMFHIASEKLTIATVEGGLSVDNLNHLKSK